MSNVQYLDLDEAVPTVLKTVKFGGKEYDFKEPSVEDFAKEMARMRDISNQMAALEGMTEDERERKEAEMLLKVMLDGIRNAFPTMPEEVIQTLSMPRITAIRSFIQEEITKDAEDEEGNG